MIEFWLSWNNRAEVLQLPVPPAQFLLSKVLQITTVNVNALGELALIGKGKLASIELSSFFPAQVYPFCQYTSFPSPYECIATIERWMGTGRPIRLIITDTPVNIAVCIENFSYTEKDGSRDVYYTLSLREYRFVTTTLTSPQTQQALVQRQVEKNTPKTYTVLAGDTLCKIAKKIYGDASRYTEISQKNNLPDPNRINEGQVLQV